MNYTKIWISIFGLLKTAYPKREYEHRHRIRTSFQAATRLWWKSLACLFLSGSGATLAEAAENAQTNPAEQIQEDELPDLALLEFLGKWETDEGEWIDPNLLIEAEIESLLGPTTDASEQNTQGQSNDD